MPDILVTPQDRANLAVTNLVQGDVGGAGRSLFAPDTLAPIQRRSMAELFGIQNSGPLQTLIETATNPTVVLGGILTLKYPVKGTMGYLTQTAQLERGIKRFLPIYDHMGSFADIYKGTNLPPLMFTLGGRVHDFHNQGMDRIGRAAMEFRGLSGAPVDAVTDVKIGLYRTQKSGYFKASMDAWISDLAKVNPTDAGKLRTALEKVPDITLTGAEERLNRGLTSYYNWVYDKTGPDVVGGLTETIERKAARFTGDRTIAPRIGQKIEDNYHPILRAGRGQAELRHFEQTNFAADILAEGQTEFGLKIAGRGKTVLSPSETERLLQRYLKDVAGPSGMTSSQEMAQGFKEYLRDFAAGQQEIATAKIASGTHLARMNRMIPDSEAIKRLGGPWENLGNVIDEVNFGLKPNGEIPTLEEMAARARSGTQVMRTTYKVDAIGAARDYNQLRARDYGWSVSPEGTSVTIGERVSQEYKGLARGEVFSADGKLIGGNAKLLEPVKAAILKDTYIPTMMGQSTYAEILAGSMWDSARWRAAETLKPGSAIGNLLERAGAGKLRASMEFAIASSPKLAYKPAMGEIANYFYSSTLGAPNLIAPVKNLFQTLITTVPEFGIKNTAVGLKSATQSFQKYIEGRWGPTQLTHEEAFSKAFPAFAKSGFDISDSLLEALDKTHAALEKGVSGIGSKWKKFQQVSMGMFSTTELWNRAVAHGAASSDAWQGIQKMAENGNTFRDFLTGEEMLLPKAIARLPSNPLAGPSAAAIAGQPSIARTIEALATEGVATTQFGGGIMNMPLALSKLPAPARQLAQFPFRYLNLLARRGAGFWGRALLGTGLAIGAAKMLFGEAGENLANQATLFGALPVPDEGNPFFPAVITPPVFQLAGSAAMAGLTGDTTQLQRSLPLLVPGGVGLARMATMTPGIGATAGQLLNRSYVDYSGKSPDGRYPLYTGQGHLVGYLNPAQLLGKAIGLGDISTQQEVALTTWMQGYGKRTTGMRQDYAEALASNNQREADSIETEYLRLNPGLTDLPLKKSQLRAMHLRRDVSRVERTMETLPSDIREQFLQTASVAFANNGPGFLGLTPEGMNPNFRSVGQRDPYRIRPQTTVQMPSVYGSQASTMQSQGEEAAQALFQ